MKFLAILITSFTASLFFCSFQCKRCDEPGIFLNAISDSITKAPRESFSLDISVHSDNNINSIVISKSTNGILNRNVLSISGNSNSNQTITLFDSIPYNLDSGSRIIYTVKVTNDCKEFHSKEKTFKVMVAPSLARIEDSVSTIIDPHIYNRFSKLPFLNKAWDLQNKLPKLDSDPNSDKDICDSAYSANPFVNGTWGSRNGSLFKKINNFNYAQASVTSIKTAWNFGGPASNMIRIVPDDIIIVNIKNNKQYALIKIKSIVDDGKLYNEDYIYFDYKLAQ